MRTTIDMPDQLMSRVKQVIAYRNITFKSLVIDALEQSLNEEKVPFVLRDASVGYNAHGAGPISADAINKAIDENRGEWLILMIAVDTNILIHAHQCEADLHLKAKETLRKLAEFPAPWCVCYHSFVEFYGVVTRNNIWREPSSPMQAMDQISAWRESPSLRVLFDDSSMFDLLSELALAGNIRGAMIHDARIAACCLNFGVNELWTIDRDFSRFPKLKTRNPLVWFLEP
jgi:predicted nucleic acid-binding protein